MTLAQVTDMMPAKTRDIHNHHFDSTIWDGVMFRDDDVVIATYAKSGTTWMQQIIGQLIFDGDPDVPVAEMSHWVDLRVPPKEVKLPMIEAQTHRRFLKTHLPVDALTFSDKAKYIYVARDGRDVVWSLFNHHANANEAWYDALNNTPGRVGPPIKPPTGDVVAYFAEWLDRQGFPFWPFWENLRSWWGIRALPNVMFVHFNDLKRDLEAEIGRIGAFIGAEPDPGKMGRILEHCSFDYMKANAAAAAPLGGVFWEGGAQTFINKGTNGRWRDELPSALSDRYESVAERELGPELASWLKSGYG